MDSDMVGETSTLLQVDAEPAINLLVPEETYKSKMDMSRLHVPTNCFGFWQYNSDGSISSSGSVDSGYSSAPPRKEKPRKWTYCRPVFRCDLCRKTFHSDAFLLRHRRIDEHCRLQEKLPSGEAPYLQGGLPYQTQLRIDSQEMGQADKNHVLMNSLPPSQQMHPYPHYLPFTRSPDTLSLEEDEHYDDDVSRYHSLLPTPEFILPVFDDKDNEDFPSGLEFLPAFDSGCNSLAVATPETSKMNASLTSQKSGKVYDRTRFGIAEGVQTNFDSGICARYDAGDRVIDTGSPPDVLLDVERETCTLNQESAIEETSCGLPPIQGHDAIDLVSRERLDQDKNVAETASVLSDVAVYGSASIEPLVQRPKVGSNPTMATSENFSSPSTTQDEDMEDDLSELEVNSPSRASSASMWPETPQSVEREAIAAPILLESQGQIVDRLMIEFRLLLNGQSGIRSRADSTEQSRSGDTQGDADGAPLDSSQSQSKRARNGHDGSEDGSYGPSDGAPQKRTKTEPQNAENKLRKLACPYYKRNPRAHQQYRSCAGPGWANCHRVKEHIYRKHKLPIRCARCCATFANDLDLSDHLRQVETCPIQRIEAVEGLDKLQEAQLRSRKRSSETEEQRWKAMYMILFPEESEDIMPSPYYENDTELDGQFNELAEYDRFMARELPRLVRSQLEATVMDASGPIERQIQGQLVDIVRNCQRELFRSFAASRQPQDSSGNSNLMQGSDEAAPTDMPPDTGLGDINAVFAPPTLLDSNSLFFSDDLIPSTTGQCPPSELTAFSDSGYGSQPAGFANGLGTRGEGDTSAEGASQLLNTADTSNQFGDSGSFLADMQGFEGVQASSEDPWSSLMQYGWQPQGDLESLELDAGCIVASIDREMKP